MIDCSAEVRELVCSGQAQRLRERHDGPRAAVALRFGVDSTTLFRWEKGLSMPTGIRLRQYHDYLKGLSS